MRPLVMVLVHVAACSFPNLTGVACAVQGEECYLVAGLRGSGNTQELNAGVGQMITVHIPLTTQRNPC
jgi:hypothetical protein